VEEWTGLGPVGWHYVEQTRQANPGEPHTNRHHVVVELVLPVAGGQ